MSKLCRRSRLMVAVCGLILAACAGPPPTPTPVPTLTPTTIPTETPTELPSEAPSEVPTEVPVLVATALPSETPAPTVAEVLPPTLTPVPSTTPSATASATLAPPPATLTPLPPTETLTFTATPLPTASPLPTATLLPSPTLIPPSATPAPTAVALVLNVPVGPEPAAAILAGGYLWVALADGSLYAYAQDGTRLAVIPTDPNPAALATDGLRLWVAHRTGIVTQVEATTGTITARWTLACGPCQLRDIVWDGTSLWVSSFAQSSLLRLDVTTGAAAALPAGADSPTRLAVDAYGLLVLHQSLVEPSVILTRHDLASGAVIGSLTASGFPTALLADGRGVWVALRSQDSGVLVRYDAATLTESFQVAADPINDLLVVGEQLYSADFSTNAVSARSLASGAVLGVQPVGALPQALVYDRGLLWVLNRRDGSLTRLWIGP